MAAHPIFADADQARAIRMWESWEMPHRRSLCMAMYALHPESVYELGCGAGPNLRLLQTVAPDLRIGGSDPVEGYQTFASQALGVPIDGDELPDVPRTGWDVVVTCYVLAYLPSSVVVETLQRLHQSEARALVLMEPMTTATAPGTVCHPYRLFLKETGWAVTWGWPVLPSPDGLDTCLIAERA